MTSIRTTSAIPRVTGCAIHRYKYPVITVNCHGWYLSECLSFKGGMKAFRQRLCAKIEHVYANTNEALKNVSKDDEVMASNHNEDAMNPEEERNIILVWKLRSINEGIRKPVSKRSAPLEAYRELYKAVGHITNDCFGGPHTKIVIVNATFAQRMLFQAITTFFQDSLGSKVHFTSCTNMKAKLDELYGKNI
eukprot:g3955.t1